MSGSRGSWSVFEEAEDEAEEAAGCSVNMNRLGNKSDSKIPM